MALLAYAQQRLRSFLGELDRAAESDFPYPDSRKALELLRAQFRAKLKQLEDFTADSDPNVVSQQCQITLRDLFLFLPFIGFIVRSTELRNAFEAFGPFLRLAVDVLEPGTKLANRKIQLVISSEWNYSPHMYDRIQNLDDFLFIGLPAPESGNPLLLPLAGHELGHAVWHYDDMRGSLQEPARAAIVDAIRGNWEEYIRIFAIENLKPDQIDNDLAALATWRLALNSCISQAEETFCDFLGLAIFGESYFYAFGYLLSPGLGSRSYRYPEIVTRVSHLVAVAKALGAEAPADFVKLFEKEVYASASAADRFLIEIADEALEKLIPELCERTLAVIKKSALATKSIEQTKLILDRFKRVAPAENCRTIADMLNAAWMAYNSNDLWSEYPSMQKRKLEVLKEVVLKNLEIFEIERIQSE